MSKTIFITGASRGFGKIWTEAFLKRGDKVAATARDLNALKDLAKHTGYLSKLKRRVPYGYLSRILSEK